MVQRIREILLNGMSPQSMPSNIAFMAELMHGSKVKELPSLRFIRKCRVVLQIIDETLTAFKVAKSEKQDQAFIYGTIRRQISLQDFFVAYLEGEELKSMIISSQILLEDKTYENQVEDILAKVSMLSKYL